MYKKIKVITRLENEDNLKVSHIIDSYVKPHSVVNNFGKNDGTIEITFVTRKGCIKQLKHDLALLNYIGIEAKIEA